MKNSLSAVIIVFILSLPGCSREPHSSAGRVMTIESSRVASSLYFTGTIQPLKTVVVPSPVDGVVVDMPFQYGEEVKQGQLLFRISSAKFLADYKAGLMQYIKAKSDFNTAQSQLTEGKFLHTNQLISDDDFKMKQSNYYAAQLAMVQAKDTLETLLRQLDIKNVNLYSLTISDVDKITNAMHLQVNSENLRIAAPVNGTVLSPSKSDEDSKKTMKGDGVKQGDVLALVGDMSGVNVRIKVNELTVNQLKLGQKVNITGIAFPDETLQGEITRVDRQGENTGGGLPVFSVEVSVPRLSSKQKNDIHVGMSAKVQIDLREDPQIMVPITALLEQNGESYVRAYDEKTGKTKAIAVKTGKTTPDAVAILSGLKTGDKIVVPDQVG